MVGLGGVDFKLQEKYITPTLTFNASQILHSASSIGTTSITFNFKGSCEMFSCTQTHSCLQCSDQHAIIHCTLAQTNPVHSFRAPKFRTQHVNNQPRTQQLHFRGPQNSNKQDRHFRFKSHNVNCLDKPPIKLPALDMYCYPNTQTAKILLAFLQGFQLYYTAPRFHIQ